METVIKECFYCVSIILQVVGLASTLLQLVGLTRLVANSLKKTMENKITTKTIDNYFYLSSR
jgi:hypothetical protein